MGEWILVRHGESVANAGGWLAGRHDAALTPAGMAQARDLRRPLASLAPVGAYCSDLLRARHTAELALEGLDLEATPVADLRERALGELEGRSRSEVREAGQLELLLSWTWRPPGGESQADVARRALSWLEAADGPGLRLAFAHAGLIRAVWGLARGEPLEAIGRIRIPNCALVPLSTPPGGWSALLRD